MRVTHIVAHPPFREGTGTVCYYNAVALRELGCDVTVYAPHWHLNPRDEQLDFYRYMPCWLAVGNAFLTPQILSIAQTDLVHLHMHFIFGAELLMLKLLATKIPLVVTYHNDLVGVDMIRRPGFWFYNRFLAPLLLRKARRIILPSLDYVAMSLYGHSIFAERSADLVEIPNGVDLGLFDPGLEATFIRDRHNLTPEDFVLLYVGSLDKAHAIKGLDMLIEAIPSLDDASIKLLAVGDGDMRVAYADQARALGIQERVVFAGYRALQTELPSYYAACDVVVIPSSFESFGVSLAQGMAMGKPVIGCNTPGVRTVVEDGKTGFLVEPADKVALVERIKQLAGDSDLRDTMGQRGRKRVVRRYTWQQSGQNLLTLYQNLLAES